MIDWFRVTTELDRAGMNHAQQAKEVDVSRRTIGYWAEGHEPPHSKGQKLLEIHKEICPGSTMYKE